MSDAESKLTPKNIFWVALSIALLLIVGYNIYRGITVTGIDVPGVMNVQFDSGQPKTTPVPVETPVSTALVTQDQTHEFKQAELEKKQEALHAKIAELEKRLQAKSQGATTNEMKAPAATTPGYQLGGMWTGIDGVQYNIQQSGNNVTFQEINPFMGVTIIAEGQIEGNQLRLNYTSILGTTGSGTLTINPAGNQMSGTFQDHVLGAATFLSLSR